MKQWMQKKKSLLALALVFLAGFAYWNWPGEAPELPTGNDIQKVEISPSKPIKFQVGGVYPTVFKDKMTIETPQKLADLLTYLSQGQKTRQDSVNDQPDVSLYVRFEVVLKDGGIQTFYIYEKGGQTYLEVPYQGIYKLKEPLEIWLADNL